ncbi:MAG: hypothetical protein IJ165_07680 [Proteobacteria bacterium]|nr:hypothetical protein [Pseudomonadota bacterium]
MKRDITLLSLFHSALPLCACMLMTSAACTPMLGNNAQTQTAATAQPASPTDKQTHQGASSSAETAQTSQAGDSQAAVTHTPEQAAPSPQELADEHNAAARAALATHDYSNALIQSAYAYQELPNDDSYAVALYAASMLSPVELMRRHDSAQTPFETAVTGIPRAHTCKAQKDMNCLARVIPNTASALHLIGRDKQAEDLTALANTDAHADRPLAAFLLPLSGSDRKIGRAMLGAALQAAGLYDHSDLPFALRFFDTRSTPESIPDILSEARKYNARLIIGPLDIRETIAASKSIADQQAMVAFTPNDDFTRNSAAAFQFSYALPQEAQKLAEFIVSNNFTKIAAAAPEDDFASSSVTFLKADLPANVSLEVISYPVNQTDLRDQAKKIAKLSPQLIYFPSSAALAERFASFLAQENIWCRLPNTPQPKSSVDTRKFVTCLSASTWAPVADNHSYKFIVNGIYLDYNEAAAAFAPEFSNTFAALYHRMPSVMEILPFVLLKMLAQLPNSAFRSQADMQNALQSLLRGQSFLMIPGFRQITEQSSEPYASPSMNVSAPVRTLVNAQ